MKTFTYKTFLVVIFFMLSYTCAIAQKKMFLRIYNIGTSTPVKGFYYSHSNSVVVIVKNGLATSISYRNISMIKTKRTVGHSILLTTVISGTTGILLGTIIGSSSNNNDEINYSDFLPGVDAVVGALGGAIVDVGGGLLAGTIIGVANKRETLIVNGNFSNWNKLTQKFDSWAP